MFLIDSDIDLSSTPRAYKSRDFDPRQILDYFLRSGKHQVEVVFTCHEYKNAYSCRNTFATAITRMHATDLEAKTLNGHVYLVNNAVERRPLTDKTRKNFYRHRTRSKGVNSDDE